MNNQNKRTLQKPYTKYRIFYITYMQKRYKKIKNDRRQHCDLAISLLHTTT